MIIETKFNVGQNVYIMQCNRPIVATIDAIEIACYYKESASIMYRFVGIKERQMESKIHETKEGLLNSL